MTENMTEIGYIKSLNELYNQQGFYGVLNEIAAELTYGKVTQMDKGLVRITTAGYSVDERILHCVVSLASMFGHNHYVGYLRGGAFYFVIDKEDMENVKLVISNDEDIDIR